ncbi:MAG: SMP-30/gluconolactonase/LRE family protein [bacterium]
MNKLEHLLAVKNEVGETPIWIPGEQALYWLDIEGQRVYRYDPATGAVQSFHVDVPVTALARRRKGRWLLATKTGLSFWDGGATHSTFIVNPETHPDLRFNDSAVDRQGRLLAGSINQKDLSAADGSLYRLDPDLTIHTIDTGYALANGIGFSPDGRTVYVTEMFRNRILAHDYDTAAGTVKNRRTFATVPADAGFPDGLTVDRDGFVWSAHWGGSRVTRYDPAGTIEREIRLPVPNVTCMGFGGKDLNELYITTGWFMMTAADRKKHPLAGDLFRMKTDVQGLVEPVFAG